MTAEKPPTGRLQRRWDSFNRRHYFALVGTGTPLDGIELSRALSRDEAKTELAQINERREQLGRPPIELI